ncbi:MAG: hypothetical protein ACK50Y_12090 [Flavobacteriia bacterium]|jgi:hypothetical protein
MRLRTLCFLLFINSISCFSQRIVQRIRLDKSLNEISGLERLNDSVLIAINDSGNTPHIFFLTTSGQVLRKTLVTNAKNNDWEDLASDDAGNLYIADAGNNSNDRKDLCVLKVNAQTAFLSDSIAAERINFTYGQQMAFPPPLSEQRFDCEAIYWRKDSIHLITKNKAKIIGRENRQPEDYVIPDISGNFVAHKSSDSLNYLVHVGKKGIQDLVTSVDCKNGKMAVLTYSSLLIYLLETSSNESSFADKHQKLRFKRLTQKEAVLLFSDKTVFVAAEKHNYLGGPYLYTIALP